MFLIMDKIAVIRLIRALTKCGIREAKDAVENPTQAHDHVMRSRKKYEDSNGVESSCINWLDGFNVKPVVNYRVEVNGKTGTFIDRVAVPANINSPRDFVCGVMAARGYSEREIISVSTF